MMMEASSSSSWASLDESAWISQFNKIIRTRPNEQETFGMMLCDISRSDDIQTELLYKVLFVNCLSPEYWAQYIEYVYKKNADKKVQMQKLVYKALELLDEQESKDNKPYLMINLLCAELKSKPIESLKYLQMMWKREIGRHFAVYYLQWADKENNLTGLSAAIEVLQKGLGTNAEPRSMLINKLALLETSEAANEPQIAPHSVSVRKPRTPFTMTPRAAMTPGTYFENNLNNNNSNSNNIYHNENCDMNVEISHLAGNSDNDIARSNRNNIVPGVTSNEQGNTLLLGKHNLLKTPNHAAVRNLFMNNIDADSSIIGNLGLGDAGDRPHYQDIVGNLDTVGLSVATGGASISLSSSSDDGVSTLLKLSKSQSIFNRMGMKHNGNILASVGKASRVKATGCEDAEEELVETIDQIYRGPSGSLTGAHHTPFVKAPMNIANSISNSVPRMLGQSANTASSPKFQRYVPKFKSEEIVDSTDEESASFDLSRSMNNDDTNLSTLNSLVKRGNAIGANNNSVRNNNNSSISDNSYNNSDSTSDKHEANNLKRGLDENTSMNRSSSIKRSKDVSNSIIPIIDGISDVMDQHPLDLKDLVDLRSNESRAESLQEGIENYRPFKSSSNPPLPPLLPPQTQHLSHPPHVSFSATVGDTSTFIGELPTTSESGIMSVLQTDKKANKKNRSVSFLNPSGLIPGPSVGLGPPSSDLAVDSGSVLAAASSLSKSNNSSKSSSGLLSSDGSKFSGLGSSSGTVASSSSIATNSSKFVGDSSSSSGFKFPVAQEVLTLNNQSYLVLGILGKGGSSTVYRVLSESGQLMAFKRVEIKSKGVGGGTEDGEGLIESYSNEINLLLKLKGSKYIIELYDYEIEKDRISMVMEAGDVDLAKVISTKRRQNGPTGGVVANPMPSTALTAAMGGGEHSLNTFFIRLIWQEMLECVNFIHDNRIVHGDLKPANFVFVKGHLKLIDFGIAKAISSDTTNIYRDSHIGTINYMAPEAISPSEDGKGHGGNGMDDDDDTSSSGSGRTMKLGRASDIWSLGCILYQMVYGKPPFAALNMIQKLHAIPNDKYPISYPHTHSTSYDLTEDDRVKDPEEFQFHDNLVIDTMKGCLQRNPKLRSSIRGKDGLLRQPFLNMAYYYSNKSSSVGSSMTVQLSKSDDSSSSSSSSSSSGGNGNNNNQIGKKSVAVSETVTTAASSSNNSNNNSSNSSSNLVKINRNISTAISEPVSSKMPNPNPNHSNRSMSQQQVKSSSEQLIAINQAQNIQNQSQSQHHISSLKSSIKQTYPLRNLPVTPASSSNSSNNVNINNNNYQQQQKSEHRQQSSSKFANVNSPTDRPGTSKAAVAAAVGESSVIKDSNTTRWTSNGRKQQYGIGGGGALENI